MFSGHGHEQDEPIILAHYDHMSHQEKSGTILSQQYEPKMEELILTSPIHFSIFQKTAGGPSAVAVASRPIRASTASTGPVVPMVRTPTIWASVRATRAQITTTSVVPSVVQFGVSRISR